MENQFQLQYIATDWGTCEAVWTKTGLYQLLFPTTETNTAALENSLACNESYYQELDIELKTYFKGFPVTFGVPLDWQGYTPFQQQVLNEVANIPYGQTMSYSEMAELVGRPKAARGVGGAVHINRIPIVVACHRLIGKDGSLTGYAGGLAMKKALLLMEKEGN